MVTDIGTAQAKEPPKFSARVQVQITADDQTKSKATSFINRELRSLGDVVVIDTNPDYIIYINAFTTKSEAGHKTGFALSVVVTQPYNSSALKLLLSQQVGKDTMQAVEILTAGLNVMIDNYLLTYPDLRKACEQIVASFDSNTLEPARKDWQALIEGIKKRRESK